MTTTNDVEHALGILEEHDWIRPVEVPSGPKGGQPTTDYHINPEVGGGGA